LKRAVDQGVKVSISYGDDFNAEIAQGGRPSPKADKADEKGLSPEQTQKLLGPAVRSPRQ